MKRSVIENQFKDKIRMREITPSKASWDRLDAMLTVAEKPKRNFKWVYFVASLLGFLLAGTFYFNQNKEAAVIGNGPIVVDQPEAIPAINTAPTNISLTKKIETPINIEKLVTSTKTKSEIGSDSVLPKRGIQLVVKEVIQDQQIPIINQKAEQEKVFQKTTYVNADELLASVDNTSQKKSSVVAKSNVKVNSNELLTQVDGELDLTFREKAIKVVNQNFKAAKLALSNRNSE